MSALDRQTNLLVAEDWNRIYQSFKHAEFQSYDFDNLRRVMITYLRENYPEDFNDYIESSEYLALIDLIAFLGQSLGYRTELNARDNFLELAERRESVLRLARLISYNPKRNVAGSGLLKFDSVMTTQSIFDSNGRNLAGQFVAWNDASNVNWYDQFIRIINAALPATRQFGSPDDSKDIRGVKTEQYRFQSVNADVPVFSFSKPVDGRSMDFEIVSTTFKNSESLYEEPPLPQNRLAFVFQNDGRGAGSTNTGFFLHFRQGILNQGSFNISQPSTNESVDIDTPNINNSDVWLYSLDSSNREQVLWAQVPNLEGNNIIYNSLSKKTKNIYGVTTRTNDTISLNFADGTFGELPKGRFKVYYRVSNGLEYTINPKDVRGVTITIPYISHAGQVETLTLSMNLVASVSNSTAAESTASIKSNAPAAYYTQNRMITGEDYNIAPLAASQSVLKVKSVNRSASGISRYFDLADPTGKYSTIKLTADDGAVYKEDYIESFKFKFVTASDVEAVVYNEVLPRIQHHSIRDFYYTRFPRQLIFNHMWVNKTTETNLTTGYIAYALNSPPAPVGETVESSLKYITEGAMVKFTAPLTIGPLTSTYSYFDSFNKNRLITITRQNRTGETEAEIRASIQDHLSTIPGAVTAIWSKVVRLVADGTGNNATGEVNDGLGPIFLNDAVPTGAAVSLVIPKWRPILSDSIIKTIIGLIYSNKPFGLRYDTAKSDWKIISEVNLDAYGEFNVSNEGSQTAQQKDASWLMSFGTDTEYFTVRTRQSKYIFESRNQVKFFYDSSNIFDMDKKLPVKDTISILSVNPQPNTNRPYSTDIVWQVSNEVNGIDGYVSPHRLQVTFNDSDMDGVVDNPEIFNDVASLPIVVDFKISEKYNPCTIVNYANKLFITTQTTERNLPTNSAYFAPYTEKTSFVVLKKQKVFQGQEDYRLHDSRSGDVVVCDTEADLVSSTDSVSVNGISYPVGQHFYFKDTMLVKRVSSVYPTMSLTISTEYKVLPGRDNLKFQYVHHADFDSRIDPGVTNIFDVYVLTKQYDTEYRRWLTDRTLPQPLPPSTDYLHSLLSPALQPIKSISDEVIFHPVKYKLLFGNSADPNLRASFKVVKTPGSALSDNDIRTQVLVAITEFFNLDNWDFGDSFYFSELNTYVMSRLAPNIINFLIVPEQEGLSFGNLFEIKAERDQLFISSATIDNVEIINTISMSAIKSSADIQLSNAISQRVASGL